MSLVTDRESSRIDRPVCRTCFAPKQYILRMALFAGYQLSREFEVLDQTGFDIHSTQVVDIVRQEPVPVTDNQVGLICVRVSFARF
jgi:hypothetical protein